MFNMPSILLLLFSVTIIVPFIRQTTCDIPSKCTSDPGRSSLVPPWPAGTKIRVECPRGYTFVDNLDRPSSNYNDTVVVCQGDGTWSNAFGSCQPSGTTCTRPATPTGGKVVGGPAGDSQTQFAVNSYITYACNNGATLSGPASIFCQSNGQWNRQPPACVPSTATRCRVPNTPANTRIQDMSPAYTSADQHQEVDPNSYITYICIDNYRMTGRPTITCRSDGSWNYFPPQCKLSTSPYSVVCNSPDVPVNGKIVYPTSNNLADGYPEGQRIQFACKAGYKKRGDGIITCQANGSWKPKPPTCRQ